MYPEPIERVIKNISKLPGIGGKSAEKITFYLLSCSNEYIDELINSLNNLKSNIKKCSICNNLSATDPCHICSNPNRNKDLLCVVENPIDIYLLENLKFYDGYYHVLGGCISPLNGINPSDLNIDNLIDRLIKNSFKELIFALSSTIEGDTTALYIKEIIKEKNIDINISQLARGIPTGIEIQYANTKSISNAFKYREKI